MSFLRDITLGQYVAGDSPVHRLDPRIKIIITVFVVAEIFFNESWPGFIVISGYLLALTLLSGISAGYVLRGLKPVAVLVMLTLFFNVFFSSGTIIWQYQVWDGFFLTVTREGLDMGLKMSIRLILLVFSTSLMTLTTSPIQLTDALEQIIRPIPFMGKRSHELAMMMTIALRFIPVLMEETERIVKAQRSRGVDFNRGNIIVRAKSFIPVLVPLFVQAFRHADDLALAMESRCYRGGEGRTRLHQLKIRVGDLMILVVSGILIAGVAFWDYYGKL